MLLLIAAVVVIVVLVTGKKDDGGGGDKPIGPPKPGPPYMGYNPYKVEMNETERDVDQVTGILIFDQSKMNKEYDAFA